MTGIAILSVANAHTGNSCDVTLDGQAQGLLAFRIAPIPDVTKAVAASFVAGVGATVWRVTVPHAGLWYVWASDTEGVTKGSGAVWVGLTDNPDLDEAGRALEKILNDNKAGIEALLRAKLPDETLKHIVYGSATAIRDFPAVLISKPRETAPYVAAPWLREHTYQFEIFSFLLHQDSASYLTIAASITGRIMEILNKPQYEAVTLASGTPLAFCGAVEGDADDIEVDEGKFAATGSCMWSGKCLKQSTGESGI